MHKLLVLSLAFALVAGPSVTVRAQDAATPPAPATAGSGAGSGDSSLLSLDLNDLMNIKVTTTSKKAESFNKVAASLYVVTTEDIRRSGATNIPEALRVVPGVDVAQVTSGQYAVSIRGFNSTFSDKLLVLIDGRAVYNNLYGGVFWEDQQIPMSDIDRIEVIRGPGTAIWGANAVQGIINIITKNAKDTKGLTASAQYSDGINKDDEEAGYSGSYGKDSYYRVYGKFNDLKDGELANGQTTRDSWIDQSGGFRVDQGTETGGKLQATGEIYRNVNDSVGTSEDATAPYTSPYNASYADTGGDLLGHYEKLMSNGSTLSVQGDYTGLVHYLVPLIQDKTNTEDLDFQDSLPQLGQHSVIFGVGYKNTGSTVDGIKLLGTPQTVTDEQSYSGYVQDQVTLTKSLSAQIGTKVEHDSFTGYEYEPSAHLGYSPDEQHTLWCSASRAVKIPTLSDLGYNLDTGATVYPGPTLVTQLLEPGKHIDSEIVAAYEAGYRVQATSSVLVDLSGFYNQYSQLIGLSPGLTSAEPSLAPASLPAGSLIVPLQFSALGSGSTYGGELASHVRVNPKWRVNVGYSYLYAKVPPSLFQAQINAPNSQTSLQSYYDFTKKIEFDSSIAFVGADKETDTESYSKLDLRLGFHPTSQCEISFGGNNLLKDHYYQYALASVTPAYEVEREFYTKVSLKY